MNVNADWNANSGDAEILNKPNLATVATSGNYNDLANRPTIGNGQITIKSDKYAGVQWRMFSDSELDYILNGRSGNRFVKCKLNDLNCLIIFPDEYIPLISLNDINERTGAFDSNVITFSNAKSLSEDGCAILACEGYRENVSIFNDSEGYYLTRNVYNSLYVYCLVIFSNILRYKYSKIRGFSVRLVSDSDKGVGAFTINANGDKVSFAPGNLQYKASTNEWKFADEQWIVIGQDNEHISSSYDGWIDLFGYGCNGINNGQTAYQPWSTSIISSDYYGPDASKTSDFGYAYMLNQKERKFSANQNSNSTVNLSDVAFSGDYNDLANIPIFQTTTSTTSSESSISLNFSTRAPQYIELSSSYSLGALTLNITSISEGVEHYALVQNTKASGNLPLQITKASGIAQTIIKPSSLSVAAGEYMELRFLCTTDKIIVTSTALV